MGVPGSSYALELAHRIGLPPALLDFAKDRMGPEKVRLESLLGELSKKTQEHEEILRSTTEERNRLSALVAEYETKLAGVRNEMKELKRKATTDAKEIIAKAQSTVERVVREIREHQASGDALRSARQTLQEVRSDVSSGEPAQDQPIVTADLRPGDAVRLRDGSTTELDVRGLSGDEAVVRVEEFLENALAAGLHRVDIIHGKGTGALRKRIGETLKGLAYVKSYRLGEWNEGGAGVTVVDIGESS
jgi:DNA mismatch repair protein MutS2